jgi:hypothetical protein
MDDTYDGLTLPSKPKAAGASGGVSQKDRRFTDTFFDIHRYPGKFPTGRPFTGEREFAANADQGHDAGFITTDLQQGEYVVNEQGVHDRFATLRSVWTAPWLPLAKYWQFNYKRKLISFNYAKMRTEEEQSRTQYFRAASKLGIQLNLRVEANVLPHPQIVMELGEPSRMGLIASAAMAGEPWLLGFVGDDNLNEELASILQINTSGMSYATSYIPPERQQQKVEAVLAAPMSTDLMEMLAKLAASAAAEAVERAFAKRDEDAQDRVAKRAEALKQKAS